MIPRIEPIYAIHDNKRTNKDSNKESTNKQDKQHSFEEVLKKAMSVPAFAFLSLIHCLMAETGGKLPAALPSSI